MYIYQICFYCSYYISSLRLSLYKLDLCALLTQLKFALEIEYNICKSTNNEICFNKDTFICDNLQEYSKHD